MEIKPKKILQHKKTIWYFRKKCDDFFLLILSRMVCTEFIVYGTISHCPRAPSSATATHTIQKLLTALMLRRYCYYGSHFIVYRLCSIVCASWISWLPRLLIFIVLNCDIKLMWRWLEKRWRFCKYATKGNKSDFEATRTTDREKNIGKK